MSKQLSPTLASIAYDIVHQVPTYHLDFNMDTDIPQRVWIVWNGKQFEVTVETWRYTGTIPATRDMPPEDRYFHTEDIYHVIKFKNVVKKLQSEHGIDLMEAIK
jgi:hypothetical protein